MSEQSIEGFVAASLDDAEMTSYHWRVLSLIIAGFFFDLFDIGIFGGLVPDMIRTNFATAGDIAFIASATFLGLFIGSVGQGELTDRFGRKTVYQANLLIYGFATLACAAAPNPSVLALCRFVAGLGLGAEIPLAFAYAAEFVPKLSRGRVLAVLNLVGGNLSIPLAILSALAFRDILGWRGIFVAIGIAVLIVFLFRIGLPESPRWLAERQRDKEALDILKRFGVTGQPVKMTSAKLQEYADPIRTVFTKYTRRLLLLMSASFCAFATTYVLLTWLPTLIGARGFSITKSLTFTLVMTMAWPVSSIFLMCVIDRIGRIKIVVVSFIVAGLFAILFANSSSEPMLLVVGFLMSFFVQNCTNTVCVLSGEVFPTAARASGCGLVFGAARIGAILASYSIVGILAYGASAAFVMIAALLGIGAISTAMIGIEPKLLSLEEAAAVPAD